MFRWREKIIIKLIRPIIEKEQKKALITIDKAIEEAKKSIQALEKEGLKRIEQRTELFLNQAIEKITSEGDKKTDEMIRTSGQIIEEEFSKFIREFEEIGEETIKKLKQIRGDKVKVIIDGGENFRKGLQGLHFERDASESLKTLKELIKEEKIESSILYDSRFPGRTETLKEEIWSSLRRSGVKVVTRPLKVMLGEKKSFVDPMVIKEIMMTLLESQYGRIVLFAGDSHYYPAIEEVQKWGIKVMVISSREQLSRELKEIADFTMYLEELIA